MIQIRRVQLPRTIIIRDDEKQHCG